MNILEELEGLIEAGLVEMRLESGFVPHYSLTTKGELLFSQLESLPDNGEQLTKEEEKDLTSFLEDPWKNFS